MQFFLIENIISGSHNFVFWDYKEVAVRPISCFF